MKFRTLTQSISRTGKGLHSGRECRLLIEPSNDALTLGVDGEYCALSELSLSGGARGSDLSFPAGAPRVRTCEHVLSALSGLGVWRARISLRGADNKNLEMPGLDGCAQDLAKEIWEKSEPTDDAPAPLRLSSPVNVGDESRFVVALPSDSFHVTYVIDYDAAPIGSQILDWDGEDYLEKLASARTFALRRDIEALQAAGLALGASLDNAILVNEDSVETTGGLRFSDEFARHKTLDLIGDLTCLGRPLTAHVVAVRAGHALHLQLVERLRSLWRV
ncbi:UDP-3-O-acyl-N-acetylglucosamine deacetylase [Synergistales bacterium]|nr:UDP-3-O-acyl-N-acetylglucosamine deacetylase [Synergistales bacterium]